MIRMACCLLLVALASCTKSETTTPVVDTPPGVDTPPAVTPGSIKCDPVTEAAPEPLLWKRHGAFITDLSEALALPADAMCTELGGIACSKQHLVMLGGNDPFAGSMYRPIPRPLPLSPIAVDRVSLAACTARTKADREGKAVVFTNIDLTAKTLSSKDTAVRTQVASLFRRFLRRNATTEEIDAVASLADGRDAMEFAALSCFVVSTSIEGVFL
jgi:hypothetical protein